MSLLRQRELPLSTSRSAIIATAGLYLLGVLGCSFGGYSPQELVALISTPEEHQRYINSEIVNVRDDLLLDHEYTEVRPRAMPEPSGAWIETFNEFATRGAGMCWDGAVSFTATLADDGYGKKVVLFSNHAIYVYQEGGLWGSGGIAPSDYNPPTFESIDELVAHQVALSGEEYDGNRIVFDFSAADTLGSPATPLLRHTPFIADYRVGETRAIGTTEKTSAGLQNLIQGRFTDTDATFSQRVSYDELLFRESEVVERESDGRSSAFEWTVLERSSTGQPVRAREVLTVDGELFLTKDLRAEYNLLAQREAELTETWRANGELAAMEHVTFEYFPHGTFNHYLARDMVRARTVYTSTDGDREFDEVVRTEYGRDGSIVNECRTPSATSEGGECSER